MYDQMEYFGSMSLRRYRETWQQFNRHTQSFVRDELREKTQHSWQQIQQYINNSSAYIHKQHCQTT